MALLNCELYSQSMRMPTTVTVLLPQDITRSKEPAPVLYLLHGRSHNHSVWQRYTSVERYAETYGIAVIMPEVNRSFYTNMCCGGDYFSYITEELPALCESMFHIRTDAASRYIAGMSMGGYGCLKAALTFPDRYAGCAAMSAVTDIRMHVRDTEENTPKKQEFRGIFGQDLKVSDNDDLFHLAALAKKASSVPNLYFSCGIEDHLYKEGADFRRHLSSLEIPYTFEEWHGVHDWVFWDEAIKKVLEHFFK